MFHLKLSCNPAARLCRLDSNRFIRTKGLWHVLIFLRHRRLHGLEASYEFNAFDLSEASFDLLGVSLPIKHDSRNVYFEPGPTQGNHTERFFRHREGPRQTFLNRIYTGLAGAGPQQPALFEVSQTSLPVQVSLRDNWIHVLRSYDSNCILLDERVEEFLSWIFRFGVTKSDGESISMSVDQGMGVLDARPGIDIEPLPTHAQDMGELVLDFLGLDRAQLAELIPNVNSVNPERWNAPDPVDPDVLRTELMSVFGRPQATTGEVALQLPTDSFSVPVEVDDRIRRMVRLAIAAYPAMILVGPPGTGKTALLHDILDEIAVDFQSTASPGPLAEPCG